MFIKGFGYTKAKSYFISAKYLSHKFYSIRPSTLPEIQQH